MALIILDTYNVGTDVHAIVRDEDGRALTVGLPMDKAWELLRAFVASGDTIYVKGDTVLFGNTTRRRQ